MKDKSYENTLFVHAHLQQMIVNLQVDGHLSVAT